VKTWRMLGRQAGKRNAEADRSSGITAAYRTPLRVYHFLNTDVDAHSWLAYTEMLADERRRLLPRWTRPRPGSLNEE
jgi:hypothetical protein